MTGAEARFPTEEARRDFCAALAGESNISAELLFRLQGDTPAQLMESAHALQEDIRRTMPLYPTTRETGNCARVEPNHRATLNALRNDRERLEYIKRNMI